MLGSETPDCNTADSGKDDTTRFRKAEKSFLQSASKKTTKKSQNTNCFMKRVAKSKKPIRDSPNPELRHLTLSQKKYLDTNMLGHSIITPQPASSLQRVRKGYTATKPLTRRFDMSYGTIPYLWQKHFFNKQKKAKILKTFDHSHPSGGRSRRAVEYG